MPDYTDDNPYGFSPGFEDRIKQIEGFTPQAQWDYKQHSNGYGTRAFFPGEIIDRNEAARRLRLELGQAAGHVDNMGVQMTPGQRDALTSLTFNAGPGWQRAGLGDAVRAGNWDAAQQHLLQYNKAGGAVEPGLVKRRAQEAQWMAGDTGPAAYGHAPAPSVPSAAPGGPALALQQQSPTGAPVADDYDAYLNAAMRQLAQGQQQSGLENLLGIRGGGIDRAAQYLMNIGGHPGFNDQAGQRAIENNRMLLQLMQHQQTRQDTLENRAIVNRDRQDRLSDMAFQRAQQAYNASEDSMDPRTGRKVPFQQWLQMHPEHNLTPGRTMIEGRPPVTPGGGAPGVPSVPPNPAEVAARTASPAASGGDGGASSPAPSPMATLAKLSDGTGFSTPDAGGFGGPALAAVQAAQGRPQAAPTQAPAPTPPAAPAGAPATPPAAVAAPRIDPDAPNKLQLSPLRDVGTYQDWGNQVSDYIKRKGGKMTPEMLDEIASAFPDSGMGAYIKSVAQGRIDPSKDSGNFVHKSLTPVVDALRASDPRLANAFALRTEADKGFQSEGGKRGTVAAGLDSFQNLTGYVDSDGTFHPGHIAKYAGHATQVPEVNSIAGAPELPNISGPTLGHYSTNVPGATEADWARNYNRTLRGREENQTHAMAMDKEGHNIGAETENIVALGRSGQQGRFEQAEGLKGEATPKEKAGALKASLELVEPRLEEIKRNIQNDYALDPEAMKEKLARIDQLQQGLNRTKRMSAAYLNEANQREPGHNLLGDIMQSPLATLRKLSGF